MYTYLEEISNRIDRLSEIIEIKSAALRHAPEGLLRISGNGKYVQYYLRHSSTDRNGTYLRKGEMGQIRALAQKEYDIQVLHAAEEERRLLCRLREQISAIPSYAETVYSSLHSRRQKLIDPIELPEPDYILQWELQSYTPKPFEENGPEHYTSRGERVRSKSEVLIADTLNEMGIPYLYEKPVHLGEITLYPDFTLLQVRSRQTVFLEHLGMMDNPEYAQSAVSRIHLYIRYNIIPGERLFLTFETKDLPLNRKLLHAQLCLLNR